VAIVTITVLHASGRAWAAPLADAPPPPPKTIDYDDTRPPPLGYTPLWRPRSGLIVGGALTFGASYGFCVFLAGTGDSPETRAGRNNLAPLFIPIAGPFVQMFQKGDPSATEKIELAVMGGVQLAGAVMLFGGLTTKRRVFVRNDLIRNVTITPMTGQATTGMLLSGHF
jgi:hypothetical protein